MFFLQDCLKAFSFPSHELVSLGGNFHIKQAEEKAERFASTVFARRSDTTTSRVCHTEGGIAEACKGLKRTESQGCVWECYRLWQRQLGNLREETEGGGEETPEKWLLTHKWQAKPVSSVLALAGMLRGAQFRCKRLLHPQTWWGPHRTWDISAYSHRACLSLLTQGGTGRALHLHNTRCSPGQSHPRLTSLRKDFFLWNIQVWEATGACPTSLLPRNSVAGAQ